MKQPDNPYLANALIEYPALYRKIISEWQQPGSDAFWLMYSANYLVRIGSTRLAIDPITLPARLGGEPPTTIADDLRLASLVILTHDHSDHMNWKVLSALAGSVRQWIIPIWMRNLFERHIPNPAGAVTYVDAGDIVDFENLRITAYTGNHWEDRPYSRFGQTVQKGLPSLAYLIEGGEKRILFAGDTRSFYADTRIPCGPVDAVVAHVFLGRLKQPDETPPLFESFCEYFGGYAANRIILSHLYEIGRDSKDIWTRQHASTIISAFSRLHGRSDISTCICGDRVDL